MTPGRELAGVDVLLLDFYGTLADAPRYGPQERTAVLLRALREHGLALDAAGFREAYRQAVDFHRDLLQEMREVHNTRWVADALHRLGYEHTPESAAVVAAVDAYMDRYVEEIEPYPEVAEAVGRLAQRYRLGVVSNFTDARPVRRSLDRHDLTRHLEAVVVSAEVGWRKPHARIFRAGLEALGATHGRTAYVGDHPLSDVEGARAAGLLTVRVARPDLPRDWYHPWGPETEFEEADLVVEDLAGLADYLAGVGADDA